MKIKRFVSIILCVLLIFSFTSMLSYAPMIAKANDDSALRGVDLSKWNGDVDFAKMKSRGVDFAILRCYSYYVDPTFLTNYDNAVENGMPVGAYNYMYATTEESAVREANAAMKALDGRMLEYPFFLDVEDKTLKELDRDLLTKLCLIELKIFEEAGYNVGIYCSKYFFTTYLDPSKLTDYDRWVARWTYYSEDKVYKFEIQPSESSYKPVCEMWQFSDAGDGNYYGTDSKRLDMNYSYVDYAANPGYRKSTDPASYSFPTKTISVSGSNKVSEVRWVQAVLYNLGYRSGLTGDYSSYIASLVSAFQSENGLPVTGEVDAATANALNESYLRAAYTFKTKYKDAKSGAEIIEATWPYFTDYTLRESDFYSEGFKVAGWNVKRGSDKKWLCVDGKWRTKAESGGALAVLPIGSKLKLDSTFCDSGVKKEVIAFYAVWEEVLAPKASIFSGNNRFDLYDESKTFADSSDFALNKGGRLAVLSDKAILEAVASSAPPGDYLVGATYSGSGWVWIGGEPVKNTSSLTGDYLVLSKTADGYCFKAVSDSDTVDGFIVESKCRHLKYELINASVSTCSEKGYTGDIVCSDCKTVLVSGSVISKKSHSFGKYNVVAPATFKKDGSKVRICSVCGAKNSVKIGRIASVRLVRKSLACDGTVKTPEVAALDEDGKAISASYFEVVPVEKAVKPGTYSVKVKFKGLYSGEATRKFNVTPAKVTDLSASEEGKTSISLKWSKSKGAVYYKVEISEDGKTWTKAKTVRETTAKITKLQKGTKYRFRVRAYDETKKLKSENSSVLKTQTLTAAPSLTLQKTSSGVKVSLKKVFGAKSYIIYRSFDGQKWKKLARTTKLSINVSDIKKGRKVFFKACAVNSYDKKSEFCKVKSIVVR